jgi:ADP-ribose pyrophosphatase YjhB (NUDIX family)
MNCATGIFSLGFLSPVPNGNTIIQEFVLTLAAGVAVIEDDRILLTKREDFEVWCIPGGMVEAGESVAQAAVRELGEETGLVVTLTDLVGIYSKLSSMGDVHSVLFRGRRTSGELTPQEGETSEFGFFGLEDLPSDLLYGQRQRVLDALGGSRGVATRQELSVPFDFVESRRDLYRLRDESDKSRRDYYMGLMTEFGPELNMREVGPREDGQLDE